MTIGTARADNCGCNRSRSARSVSNSRLHCRRDRIPSLVPQNVACVAARVFGEILLVVIFGEIKFRGPRNLRRDRPLELAGLVPLRLHALGGLLLCFARVENS